MSVYSRLGGFVLNFKKLATVAIRKSGINRRCLSVVALPLVIGLIGLASAPAHAGRYVMSYSGGTCSSVHTSSNNTSTNTNFTYPYTGGPNGTGFGTGTGWGSGYNSANVWSVGSASLQFSGTITATFTWVPDYNNEPPPPAVVIAESSTASFNGGGTPNALPTESSVNNGLGFPMVITNTTQTGSTYISSQRVSQGTRYQIRQNPGASFSISCSPSASVAGNGPPNAPTLGSGGGGVSVSYSATATPLEVTLSGGIGPKHAKQFLIGQKVTAALSPGGLPVTSRFWNVSGGAPFKNWTASNSSATFVPIFNETGGSLVFYFADPDTAPPQASCSTHLAVPSGAAPAQGFDVFLSSRPCEVDPPASKSMNVYIGNVVALPQNGPPYNQVALQTYYTYPNDGQAKGMYYDMQVTSALPG